MQTSGSKDFRRWIDQRMPSVSCKYVPTPTAENWGAAEEAPKCPFAKTLRLRNRSSREVGVCK